MTDVIRTDKRTTDELRPVKIIPDFIPPAEGSVLIEVGYKYMSFDSDKGDDTRRWADGTTITFEDAFAVDATRHGLYAMAA